MRRELCSDCVLRTSSQADSALTHINRLTVSKESQEDTEWLESSDLGIAVAPALALTGARRCAQLRTALGASEQPKRANSAIAFRDCGEIALIEARVQTMQFESLNED